VSSTGPSGQGNFFERLLGDLVQMMGSTGTGVGPRVEMARTFAHNVAAGAAPEPNVDPSERIRLEELARVAEMHVAETSGLAVSHGDSPMEILAVGPGSWAWQTVEDWQFLLEAMTGEHEDSAVALAGQLATMDPMDETADEQAQEDLLNRVLATMGPMLAAMQLGSAVGHLARTTMGTYELPIPRRAGSGLLFVPANITRFAGDWGLAPDEVRIWVCLRELTTHAVLTRPHVAERLRSLLRSFMQGAANDASGLASLMGNLDPSDPDSIRRLMEEPGALLGVETSPERAHVARDLAAITAALIGYVEHVVDEAGGRLLGDRTLLQEAWRRNQVEGRPAMSSTESFLGLDTGSAQAERGSTFVKGVVERSGEKGLSRLWESESTLPTPSEVDAPGLWLERLKIQDAEEE
jgi:putative hydrolase